MMTIIIIKWCFELITFYDDVISNSDTLPCVCN